MKLQCNISYKNRWKKFLQISGPEWVQTRLISEAKQGQAWLVLGWKNQIQYYVKRVAHHDWEVFILRMQGWFNSWKSIDRIQHSKPKKDHGSFPPIDLEHILLDLYLRIVFCVFYNVFLISNSA